MVASVVIYWLNDLREASPLVWRLHYPEITDYSPAGGNGWIMNMSVDVVAVIALRLPRDLS